MYYENISLQAGPAVTTELLFYKGDETKCLIQILHTLVSILPGDRTKENEVCKGHFGYASVGKILAVGKEISLGEEQYVLLPPVFSKFLVLDASSDAFEHPYQIRPISSDIDCVESLFITVLCIAFYLLDRINESYEKHKQVLIFGHTLMAEVLHFILSVNNIDAVVIDDCSHGKYRESLYDINHLESGVVLQIGQVVSFNLENSVFFHDIEALKASGIKCIEVPPYSQAVMQYVHYDLFNEAVDYLRHNDTSLRKLVVQHVHAESVSQTCRAMDQYRFYGPCIVYDW